MNKFEAHTAPAYIVRRIREAMDKALASGRRAPILRFNIKKEDMSPGSPNIDIRVRNVGESSGNSWLDLSWLDPCANSPQEVLKIVESRARFAHAVFMGTGVLWRASSGWADESAVQQLRTAYDRPHVCAAPGEFGQVIDAVVDAARSAGKEQVVCYRRRTDDHGIWERTRLPACVESLESLIYEEEASHVGVDHIEMWSIFRGWAQPDKVFRHLNSIYGGSLDFSGPMSTPPRQARSRMKA